jgi:pimeloyl-ACP methyl ester carboxylesterase
VVLHHGFITNADIGWKRLGVVDALVNAGYWVVAIDARGHGNSGKPHEVAHYGETKMARDAADLLDVLAVPEADFVGYSMGAMVGLILATTGESRISRLIAADVGAAVAELGGAGTAARTEAHRVLAAALRTEDPSTIEGHNARAFRAFADYVGGDRLALAAQAEAMHVAAIALDRITVPTLVVAGDQDLLSARPEALAAAIPGAGVLVLPGDHLTTPGSPAFIDAVIEFLGEPSE